MLVMMHQTAIRQVFREGAIQARPHGRVSTICQNTPNCPCMCPVDDQDEAGLLENLSLPPPIAGGRKD